MAVYTGYSKKGLKRTFNHSKWIRVLKRYIKLEKTLPTRKILFKENCEIQMTMFLYNNYIYVNEVKIYKDKVEKCWYKVNPMYWVS